MNFAYFWSSQDWRWKPDISFKKWKIKDGEVWYLRAFWLQTGVQLDNEKDS